MEISINISQCLDQQVSQLTKTSSECEQEAPPQVWHSLSSSLLSRRSEEEIFLTASRQIDLLCLLTHAASGPFMSFFNSAA